MHRYSCAARRRSEYRSTTIPGEEDERRLVVADLCLVEQLSNGSEAPRSQPISVRGLPNRPSRVYFDRMVDANVTLDIYGTLISRLESGVIAISVETRSRWAPSSGNLSGPQRSVKSDIQVKPAETVEIRLPMLGDEAGPFAKRAYSIRIRARQLLHFGRVELAHSGYVARINLDESSGPMVLGVGYRHGSIVRTCRQFAVPVVPDK